MELLLDLVFGGNGLEKQLKDNAVDFCFCIAGLQIVKQESCSLLNAFDRGAIHS